MLIILQKAIAASGYCSRRTAEELIRNDRVKINGQTATLGAKADPEKDKITVNAQPTRYISSSTNRSAIPARIAAFRAKRIFLIW